MIEARGLVKRYGSTTAVDHLSFDVRPGTVTGFLGPNGAGKSTTMRMIIGLDRPDAGRARIGGRQRRGLFARQTGRVTGTREHERHRCGGFHAVARPRIGRNEKLVAFYVRG
jgi:ABC-2 type transport system ATP-binding protein